MRLQLYNRGLVTLSSSSCTSSSPLLVSDFVRSWDFFCLVFLQKLSLQPPKGMSAADGSPARRFNEDIATHEIGSSVCVCVRAHT